MDRIATKRPTPEYVRRFRGRVEGLRGSELQKKIDAEINTILDKNNVKKAPVFVPEIAESLLFDLFFTQFNDGTIGDMADTVENMGGIDSNRYIRVEKRCDNLRSFGTIAHELGHFFIHCNDADAFYERKPLFLLDVSPDDKEKEEQADLFKDSLQMPLRFLKPFIKERCALRRTWRSVLQDIKDEFLVPRHTARARIESLLHKAVCDDMLCEELP